MATNVVHIYNTLAVELSCCKSTMQGFFGFDVLSCFFVIITLTSRFHIMQCAKNDGCISLRDWCDEKCCCSLYLYISKSPKICKPRSFLLIHNIVTHNNTINRERWRQCVVGLLTVRYSYIYIYMESSSWHIISAGKKFAGITVT